MSSDTYLTVIRTDSSSFDTDRLLSFSFGKEMYTPYTSLTVRFDAPQNTGILNISEVKLYVCGMLVHHGLIDRITSENSGGGETVTVVSKGFTSLLCRNQIEPGLKTGVSINSLMDSFYLFPHITHENNDDRTGYIFVKSSSSMWDGIACLSYKAQGTYPYIRGTNCVRITPYSEPRRFIYTSGQLISTGETFVGSRMVSHFHMADMADEYGSYEYENSAVTQRGIIRHVFFELDKSFLHSPNDALTYRNSLASRGCMQHFCVYKGYWGEDLSDLISFGTVTEKRIAAVEISGAGGLITTKITTYD